MKVAYGMFLKRYYKVAIETNFGGDRSIIRIIFHQEKCFEMSFENGNHLVPN